VEAVGLVVSAVDVLVGDGTAVVVAATDAAVLVLVLLVSGVRRPFLPTDLPLPLAVLPAVARLLAAFAVVVVDEDDGFRDAVPAAADVVAPLPVAPLAVKACFLLATACCMRDNELGLEVLLALDGPPCGILVGPGLATPPMDDDEAVDPDRPCCCCCLSFCRCSSTNNFFKYNSDCFQSCGLIICLIRRRTLSVTLSNPGSRRLFRS